MDSKPRRKRGLGSAGQGMVELGLMLPFLLVVIGAVVDFGLAIFAGQVAEYASRDAARFAATLPPAAPSTPVYPSEELGSCTGPVACAASAAKVLAAAGARLPQIGLFDAFSVNAAEGEIAGEDTVTVTVSGNYSWRFLWLISVPITILGDGGFPTSITITRSTTARWEWQ